MMGYKLADCPLKRDVIDQDASMLQINNLLRREPGRFSVKNHGSHTKFSSVNKTRHRFVEKQAKLKL